MPRVGRRHVYFSVIALFFIFLYCTLNRVPQERLSSLPPGTKATESDIKVQHNSKWAKLPLKNPVKNFQSLPNGEPLKLPRIQHPFSDESEEAKNIRVSRLKAVKESYAHSWEGYKKHAWLKDEVAPLSGGSHESFGNWSATLVDSLDSLWIMGFQDEFDEAIKAIATIDFESCASTTINLFETNIRYLGGLLSAYDLSGRAILLEKALQLGNMLYVAFDTPNRMPVPYWDWKNALGDHKQKASFHGISAEIGSLSLEFTHLSQLSGDQKFFDAIQRITDIFARQQHKSTLPGLWPVYVNPSTEDFSTGTEFSLSNMADSLYEYLPKMYILVGGLLPVYKDMYQSAIKAAKEHIFFRPMNKEERDVLLPGVTQAVAGQIKSTGEAAHLGCFVGGMVGIGAQIFHTPEDLAVAERLANGCVWAYNNTPSGIMPEMVMTIPCANPLSCPWNEDAWHDAVRKKTNAAQDADIQEVILRRHLRPGFVRYSDSRYLLRPEAVESLFILYRITGDASWQEKAWRMFTAIEKATRTDIAYAALDHVDRETPEKIDKMESFWTAETLKYFYLVFSEPDVISLDEFVFSTEAHPFRRPLGVSKL